MSRADSANGSLHTAAFRRPPLDGAHAYVAGLGVFFRFSDARQEWDDEFFFERNKHVGTEPQIFPSSSCFLLIIGTIDGGALVRVH